MVKAVVGANWGDEGKGKITASATAVAAFFPKLLFPEKFFFFRGFWGGIFPPA